MNKKRVNRLSSLGPEDFVFMFTNKKELSNFTDIGNISQGKDVAGPVDFETAISASGFGKFNYLLMLAIAPATWSGMFDTSLMSYVSPAAQCDLELTLENKGMLNAIMFLGIICSAFLWGFLADNFGRRNIMLYGYFVDGILNLCCSFSTNYTTILIFKFFTGFVACGPFVVLRPFVSEFHSVKYRSKIILFTGILYATGNLALPCLAWWILPRDLHFNIIELYVLRSWQIFILICSLPIFLAAFVSLLLPESPKYLMAVGRNEEALEIFQKIYSMNTGKSKDTYPIKNLVNDIYNLKEIEEKNLKEWVEDTNRNKLLDVIQDGWIHIRPLFFPPYLTKMILVYIINLGVLLGVNTLRLWLPQFFKTMDEYSQLFNEEGSICDTIYYVTHMQYNHSIISKTVSDKKCIVEVINNQVYINSIIVSVITMIGYLFAGSLLNVCGKKNLVVYMLMISGLSGLGIRWSPRSEVTVALSSVSVALACIGCSTLDSVIIEMFPMNLRTMISSLTMMSGRIGSIVGNLIFPILLTLGCLAPFLFIGGSLIVCAVLVFILSISAKK